MIVASAAVMTFMVLVVVARIEGVDVQAAVADPQETTGYRTLGVVSHAGVLLFAATVSACLLTAMVSVPGTGPSEFFGASAAVVGMLLVDDFLLVHELGDDVLALFVDFTPTKRRKDLVELAVFGVYGLVIAGYLIQYRSVIAASAHGPLTLAGVCLFGSLATDMGLVDLPVEVITGPSSPDVLTVIEEGLKFVGIAFVTLYYFTAARATISRGEPIA